MMKLIYVAGPYSSDNKTQIKQHIRDAEVVSLKLNLKGWNVYTPHKNNAFYEEMEAFFPEMNWDFWMQRCFDMISRCDAILFLKNWEKSRGSRKELEFALKTNIPIFYETEGLPDAN